MINYSKVVGDALKFAIEPKRWLPLFIIDLVFATISLVYLSANFYVLQGLSASQTAGHAALAPIASSIVGLGLLGVVWFLLKTYVSAALFHQSAKPKEFDKSWKVARKRYPSFLAVVIIVAVVSTVLGVIPFVGWILSIISVLMLFYSMPAAVLGKMGFEKSLRDSYKIFKKKTIQVIATMLVIGIFSGIIVLIFSVPLMATAWTVLFPVMMTGDDIQLFSTLVSNAWAFFPGLLVMLAGASIGKVFSFYCQAHFYRQLRGRRIF